VRGFWQTATSIQLGLVAAISGCDAPPAPRLLGDQPAIMGDAVDADEAPSLQLYITGGRRDSGHPAVGATISAGRACTATLIGPCTVLTAAHCIGSPTPAHTSFLLPGSRRVAAKAVARHPDYVASGRAQNDIAVVALSEKVLDITPMPLNVDPLQAGQAITIVGYGSTGGWDQSFGTKRVGQNEIARVDAASFTFTEDSNVCSGDSGGPSLVVVDGEEHVAGVHSQRIGPCGYGGLDMRVDRYADWIAQHACEVLATPGSETPTESPETPSIPDPAAPDSSDATEQQPAPAEPSGGIDNPTAGQGQRCAQLSCDDGLACTSVFTRSGKLIDQYCMERCSTLGNDPVCDGAEICAQSRSAGKVCFDATSPGSGFTHPDGESAEPSGPAPQPESKQPPTSGDCGLNAHESEALALLNRERASRGLGALSCDPLAVTVARAHSQDMCDNRFFSHTNLEGQSPFERMRAAGLSFRAAGENIAAGQRSASSVHQGWMNSPGHRSNMLNGVFSQVGIGFVKCRGSRLPTYWTEVLFTP
jgi:uncharacterized protein YkwD/V8-like Glu-specific endopeptidase